MRKHSRLIALFTVAIAALIALTTTNALNAQQTPRQPTARTTPAPAPAPAASSTATDAAPGAAPAEELAPGADTLVVYFSRTGENFPNLDLEVGNTARVALAINDRVAGDIYEIVPAEAYPEDPDETSELAQQEQDDGIYPEIAGTVADTSGYDTVFLGYPNWWGEQPMVVQTFMRDNDLGDATIVPFTTHDGSGFGNSLSVLSEYYPSATILEGLALRGTAVADDPDSVSTDVNAWLDGLGL